MRSWSLSFALLLASCASPRSGSSADASGPGPALDAPTAGAGGTAAGPGPAGGTAGGIGGQGGSPPLAGASGGPPGGTDARPGAGMDGPAMPPGTPQAKLQVTLSGSGTGEVTSTDGRVRCMAACSIEVNPGTSLVLMASPVVGDVFMGWTGACSGRELTCNLVVDQAKQVGAVFDRRVDEVWAQRSTRVTGLALGGQALYALIEVDREDSYDDVAAAAGRRDLVLARFDAASGARAWARRWTGVAQDGGTLSINLGGVVVADNGRVVVTGPLTFPAQFGSTNLRPSDPGDDGFVLEASDAGEVLGARADIGGMAIRRRGSRIALASTSAVSRYTTLNGIAPAGSDAAMIYSTWHLDLDAQGAIVAGGSFREMLRFGSASLTGAANEEHAFVAKIGADNRPAWARSFRAIRAMVSALTVDGSGDVLATVEFEGALTVGNQTITGLGEGDVVLLKLSGASGNVVWSRSFASQFFDSGRSVAVTPDGSIYLSVNGVVQPGEFSGTFLARLSPADGSPQWKHRLTTPAVIEPMSNTDLLLGSDRQISRVKIVP